MGERMIGQQKFGGIHPVSQGTEIVSNRTIANKLHMNFPITLRDIG
jgi:hypothetical protein